MLKIAPLFSGSSGNSVFIRSGRAGILVDAGCTCLRISEELAKIGEDIKSVDAIVVTHEHVDHIRGIDVISRKCDIPVYANDVTLSCLEHALKNPCLKHMKTIDTADFYVGDINVSPFRISHDAVNPFGYSFRCGNSRVSVMTDTGRVTNAMLNAVSGSDIVLLEANHDIDMLNNGPYPYRLRQRILSSKGHLSNNAAAVTAYELAKSGTRGIILGHLSVKNNTEELAYGTVSTYLKDRGVVPGRHVGLILASRDHATGIYEVK